MFGEHKAKRTGAWAKPRTTLACSVCVYSAISNVSARALLHLNPVIIRMYSVPVMAPINLHLSLGAGFVATFHSSSVYEIQSLWKFAAVGEVVEWNIRMDSARSRILMLTLFIFLLYVSLDYRPHAYYGLSNIDNT